MELVWRLLKALATIIGLVLGIVTIIGLLQHHDVRRALDQAVVVVSWVFLGLVALFTLSLRLRGRAAWRRTHGLRLTFSYMLLLTPLALTGVGLYVLGTYVLGWVAVGWSAVWAVLLALAFLQEATGRRCTRCRDRAPVSANFCPKCGASLAAHAPASPQ